MHILNSRLELWFPEEKKGEKDEKYIRTVL